MFFICEVEKATMNLYLAAFQNCHFGYSIGQGLSERLWKTCEKNVLQK